MDAKSSLADTTYLGECNQSPLDCHDTDSLHGSSSSTHTKLEPDEGQSDLGEASREPFSVNDQTIEQDVALKIIPLSAFDIVKRHHDTRLSTRKNYRRRNVSGGLHQRASSVGSPDLKTTSPSILRQSSRIKKTMTPKSKLDPSDAERIRPPVLRQSSRLKKISTPSSSKTTVKPKAATKNTHTITLATTQARNVTQAEHSPGTKVTFYFFLMNENFGVFPVALKDCNTFDLFFEEAEKAWKFQGGNGGKNSMAAVMLEYDGCAYPMNVRWMDSQMYDRMMEWVEIGEAATAKAGRIGDLVVKVKCIRK